MTTIVLITGIFIGLVSLIFVAMPDLGKRFLNIFRAQGWWAYATLFRIAVGVVFFFAAPNTQSPQFIRILGILIVLGGLLIPIIGVNRLENVITKVVQSGPTTIRIWGIAGLVLAYFILKAVTPL